MAEISNIDAIIELIMRDARARAKHDIAYGLHEVMSELSHRTQDIYNTLREEEKANADVNREAEWAKGM